MNENTNPGEEVKVHPDYANQVVAVIRSNLTPKYMSQQIADFHENDIAQALDQMTKAERAKLYSLLDRNTLADVISARFIWGSWESASGWRFCLSWTRQRRWSISSPCPSRIGTCCWI